MDINFIRDMLSEHIDYDEGLRLRKELHDYSVETYEPKYDDRVYIEFMNDNESTFNVNHPQSKNHPYYFTLFTVASQHVMGDCVCSCVDAAINEIKGVSDE